LPVCQLNHPARSRPLPAFASVIFILLYQSDRGRGTCINDSTLNTIENRLEQGSNVKKKLRSIHENIRENIATVCVEECTTVLTKKKNRNESCTIALCNMRRRSVCVLWNERYENGVVAKNVGELRGDYECDMDQVRK